MLNWIISVIIAAPIGGVLGYYLGWAGVPPAAILGAAVGFAVPQVRIG